MYCLFHQYTSQWKLQYLPLAPVIPVPADIVIARSQQLKLISDLAHEIGLMPNEVILSMLYCLVMYADNRSVSMVTQRLKFHCH